MGKNKFLKYYKESFKYLGSCYKQILFIFGIFVLFGLAGFFIPVPEYLSNQILEYIKQLLEKTENFGFFGMFKFIFLNNLKSSFFGWIFGLPFGIFSVFTSLFNGYILGFVASESVVENGFVFLWRILPHGIFELPAVFISLGMGLKLGSFFLKKNKKEFLSDNLKKSFITFLLIVIPLLIIAAIIESALIVFGA
ncbi:MAG: stage II sporulation protein M [Candidatus Pacearchaeota archaeon]|jgi:stage II sporulation protein M